jgi:hypothetical protein
MAFDSLTYDPDEGDQPMAYDNTTGEVEWS